MKIAGRLVRAKRRVKELEIELEPFLRNIPEHEMSVYEENIARIKKRSADKLKNFKRRRQLNRSRRFGETMNISDFGMIVNTSVSYARYYVKKADLDTLRAALEHEKQNRKRKTMIQMLEREISKRQ